MTKQYNDEELTEGLCWDLSMGEDLIGHAGNDFGTSTLADVPMEFTVLSKNPLIFFSFSVRIPCFNSMVLGTITVIYR